MHIKITYCKPCRFWGQALKDLDEIYRKHEKEIDSVQLVAGDGGVYRVEADGTEVFSKDAQTAFPRAGSSAAYSPGNKQAAYRRPAYRRQTNAARKTSVAS